MNMGFIMRGRILKISVVLLILMFVATSLAAIGNNYEGLASDKKSYNIMENQAISNGKTSITVGRGPTGIAFDLKKMITIMVRDHVAVLPVLPSIP
jgi:hypothetical protein